MRIVALAFAAFLAGCPPVPVTPTPDATDATAAPADAWAPPAKEAAQFFTPCESAYLHMRSIGCEPRRPDGGSWIVVCQNERENGLSFNLGCINSKVTPAGEEACGVRCGAP